MPEGHTIHRIAADHHRDFAGQHLRISSPQGRFAEGASILDGALLLDVQAYGKHLIYNWDRAILHVHLGLYGKFRRQPSPPCEPRGQVRLRFVGDTWTSDLNGPTACELMTSADVQRLLNRLGADPLRPDAVPERAWNRISKSRTAIGAVLMNQQIIAGVGNIYRSEVLHLLKIHPNREARSLQRHEFEALWQLLVELLRIGKQHNRIIIASPEEVGKPRSRMNQDERLLIYKKERCSRCKQPVESWTLAARKVFACPVCQPLSVNTTN